jgi:hypothetical protein
VCTWLIPDGALLPGAFHVHLLVAEAVSCCENELGVDESSSTAQIAWHRAHLQLAYFFYSEMYYLLHSKSTFYSNKRILI